MNNKQLAEMVRKLRKEKLEEIIGKPPPFNPVHTGGKQDASSPNQYAHRKQSVAEGMQQSTLGADRSRAMNIVQARLKPSQRVAWTNDGQQSMKRGKRYTAEENKKEIELGPTDTGQPGETVTRNPTDETDSAKGSMNKNTTTKELKEKKNATMG
jgi:hypothetical protein